MSDSGHGAEAGAHEGIGTARSSGEAESLLPRGSPGASRLARVQSSGEEASAVPPLPETSTAPLPPPGPSAAALVGDAAADKGAAEKASGAVLPSVSAKGKQASSASTFVKGIRSLSTPKLASTDKVAVAADLLASAAGSSAHGAKHKLSMVESLQKNIHKLEHSVSHSMDPFLGKKPRSSHKAIPAPSPPAEHEMPPSPPSPPVAHWRGSGQKVYWGGVDPHDIEGVEALLEAYFMQVDFSMSRLVILKERIDNTEDLINIELDSRRNELVALEVILTTLTLVFSIISAVGGVFGMNLKSGIEEDPYAFYIVTALSIAAAVSAFLAIIIYCRQKRLMFMGVTKI
mmetsp:Transcript_13639/g.34420  ORF Transcript_13639/g.34420 Transcript_13639/m.34420 type:complete len:345 (-) Transcript_13639:346-1380(-)